MSFDAKTELLKLLCAAKARVAPAADEQIILERPRQAQHGDWSSNLALHLAKQQKANPRLIAQALLDALPTSNWVAKAEIAGAGFINFTLTAAAKSQIIKEVLADGADFGRGAPSGQNIMVEFVSANPTGPLHVGHGRGAAFGDALASLLAFAGHTVSREYYVNDAGRQMDILAVSTWLRYLELFNEKFSEVLPFPANAYQGDYVRAMAQALASQYQERFARPAAQVWADVPPAPSAEQGEDSELTAAAKQQREDHLDGLIRKAKALLGADWAIVHRYALTAQLADCRADLKAFGVRFDCWFSEQSLFAEGKVAETVAALAAAGVLYEQAGARWFRATQFGDEKDRVVQRENGAFTYFASDIAYHENKFQRGFTQVIDIWGADHHGYIPRLAGALRALGQDAARFTVELVQFVSLFRDGAKVGMSTRAGEYVTLRELREEVGNDACRFFYLMRRADQALDFDLTLAKAHSNDNPVYYVQYAHARICSVLAQWQANGGEESRLLDADLATLASPHELTLCARLGEFRELVATAAQSCAPHSVVFYLRELAAEFHAWYNAQRLLADDEATKAARLALALAVRQVLRNGLKILGVSAPVSM